MAGYRGEVFIHLAAEMDVRYSVADPIANARNNVLGLLAVIDSARTCGARKVVFASSGGTIYGDQERYPVDESARVDPLSPYGASKVCGEIYLQVYRHLHRLQTTALALGNVYGPRQDPNGEAGVVSIFASALLEGRQTVIYGDGSATRDFVYVDDVVEAFVLATGTAGDGLRLNIGTGHETSVRTLHRFIADAAERPDRPTFLPARSGELDRVGLDSTAARRVLGWQSRQGIADGIARGGGPRRRNRGSGRRGDDAAADHDGRKLGSQCQPAGRRAQGEDCRGTQIMKAFTDDISLRVVRRDAEARNLRW
jgi:UDP-glucose 4-epimerase